jgi:hypothetical protein
MIIPTPNTGQRYHYKYYESSTNIYLIELMKHISGDRWDIKLTEASGVIINTNYTLTVGIWEYLEGQDKPSE